MLLRTLAGVAALSLLSGCQLVCAYDCYSREKPRPSRTIVTVIPASTDAHIGTVVVDPDNHRLVLNTAYASAEVFSDGKLVPFQSSEKDSEAKFGDLLQARPQPPVSLTTYFESGTDRISDETTAVISRLRGEVARRGDSEITVIGHTDRAGSVEDNDYLAMERATRIRERLISLGFPAGIISVEARGERESVTETADGVAEAANRRVEINIR